jgi:murein DD-endopeptidase MepM/ murein hydrolase activator NlpD
MLRRTFLAGGVLLGQPAAGLRVEPKTPFVGSPILFSFAEEPGAGTWMGRSVTFGKEGGRWVALAAVGLDTKAGSYFLTMESGEKHAVRVAAHLYRTGMITVAPQFVQPPKAVSKRIAEEQAIKKWVFATRSERLWRGAFAAPTDTAQSSPFGTRRVYNGQTKSTHQGLDFRAVVGTPVHAANAGRVLIAQEMYFEGGFVVVDHGEGLFTLYMHFSGFAVKAGDVVERGQVLGESGKSGRVTGPHLHFGAQWQGLYMEPATLLGLHFS